MNLQHDFFRLTPLFILFVFIAQALCLEYTPYSDGSYGWRYIRRKANSMSDSDVKRAAQSAYHDMVADAAHERVRAPSEMAALYISNSRGRYIILASSIRGVGHTSVAAEDICSNQQ